MTAGMGNEVFICHQNAMYVLALLGISGEDVRFLIKCDRYGDLFKCADVLHAEESFDFRVGCLIDLFQALSLSLSLSLVVWGERSNVGKILGKKEVDDDFEKCLHFPRTGKVVWICLLNEYKESVFSFPSGSFGRLFLCSVISNV